MSEKWNVEFFPRSGTREALIQEACRCAIYDTSALGSDLFLCLFKEAGRLYLPLKARGVPGDSTRGLCGLDRDGERVRMGSPEAIWRWRDSPGPAGPGPARFLKAGAIPLLVATEWAELGLVALVPSQVESIPGLRTRHEAVHLGIASDVESATSHDWRLVAAD
jgi:hypothetical protein